MKRQVTTKDVQKTGLAVGLLLVLGGAGWFTVQKFSMQQAEEQMGQQMDRESNLSTELPAVNSLGGVENDPEKAPPRNPVVQSASQPAPPQ